VSDWSMKDKWRLIGTYPVQIYACGLKAGQKLRLRKDVVVRDTDGCEAGTVFKAGEFWEVILGSAEPPLEVWLQRPKGDRHTWCDTMAIFDQFEIVD
jgi:hypothetical protein